MDPCRSQSWSNGAFALAALVLVGAPAADAASREAPPPNVVLIVLDDLGSEKLCFNTAATCATAPGVTYADIPNMRDRIAGQGIRYTRAYVSPTCSPTRANILTGKYGFRTGVLSYIMPPQNAGGTCAAPIGSANLAFSLPVDPSSPSLPQAMKNRGYATGAFGKWHLNYIDPTVPVTTEPLHPIQHGFDTFVGHIGNNELDDATHDGHFNWRRFDVQGGVITSGPPEPQWDARVVRQQAQAFIQQQAGGPHFTNVLFNPPHAPFQMPHFEGWSGGVLRPLNISKPTWNLLVRTFTLAELASRATWPADGGCGSSPEADDFKGRLVQQANIEAIDWEIGQLLDTIEATDAAAHAQTVVIVIGDNGTPVLYVNSGGSPNLGPAAGPPYPPQRGKNTLYDLGINVPLLVRYPGVTGGVTCSGLVSAVDLYATILQIAGDVTTAANDGYSLWPSILANGGPTSRPYAYSEKLNKNAWQWTGTTWNDLGAIVPNCSPPVPAPQFDRCLVMAGPGGDLYKYINYEHAFGVGCSPPSMCPPSCPGPSTDFCTSPPPTSFPEELYNLTVDPNEVCNLLCGSSYDCTLLGTMRTLMGSLSGP